MFGSPFWQMARAAALAAALLATLSVSPALAGRQQRITPVVRVVQTVGPAVVNIYTRGRAQGLYQSDDPRQRLFRDYLNPQPRARNSLGTGVIIDGRKGLIVTNSHVVAAAGEIQVKLIDERTFGAELVGADPASDLAVLRIKTDRPLPQVRLGNSDEVMIGETVVAIGNPFGLSHTVTTGVISAVNRRVNAGKTIYHHLMQTDASINPGNSGGPLLNIEGELIAINTAVRRQAQGIGFAIPINRVKRIVFDLARYRTVIPAWLGLHIRDLDLRLADQLGMEEPAGALVMGVMGNSPAHQAGLKRGDVILAMNGTKLANVWTYGEVLDQSRVGDTVKLRVLSGGQVKTISSVTMAFPLARARDLAWYRLGFVAGPMDQEASYFHHVARDQAVMITQVRSGSWADRIGVRVGDLVMKVGQRRTTDLESFHQQVARTRLFPKVTVLLRRGRAMQYFSFGN